MKKLFYMIILLNITSIFMGSNAEANKKAAYAVLTSIIPCAAPVSLIHDALNTNNKRELLKIEDRLFSTSMKSVIAILALGASIERCPKLSLFFAAHVIGIVPGSLGFMFAAAKQRD
jgi:hypothetical protein